MAAVIMQDDLHIYLNLVDQGYFLDVAQASTPAQYAAVKAAWLDWWTTKQQQATNALAAASVAGRESFQRRRQRRLLQQQIAQYQAQLDAIPDT